MRELDIPGLRSLLLDAVLKNQSIQKMFQRIYDHIGLPLNAFDTSFALIAYAFPRPFYFAAWERIAENRKANDEDIVNDNYLEYQERMYASKRTSIFDYGTCEGYPQACGPVIVDGLLVGYMGTMIEDAKPDQVIMANDMICDAMSMILRSAFKRDRKHLEREGLKKLIENGDLSGITLKTFSAEFKPPYSYLIITAEDSAVSTLEYVRNILCTKANGILGNLSGEISLKLLMFQSDGLSYEEQLELVSFVTAQHNLTAGVSDKFSSLYTVKAHQMQAMLALSEGIRRKENKHLYAFTDLFRDIINCCILEHYGDGSFLHPAIDALIQEEKTGEESRRTLTAYYNNLRKCAHTAEYLNVHKNTVLGRLKRISQVLDIDLDEPQNAFSFALQLEIYETACTLAEQGDESDG